MSIPAHATPSIIPNSLNTFFLSKTPQLSCFRKQSQHLSFTCRKISCKTNDDDQQHLQNHRCTSTLLFDRRNMLISLGGTTIALAGSLPAKADPKSEETVTFPKPLDSVIKTKVVRPRKSRTKNEKEEDEEVLVINMKTGMSSQQFTAFDVYVNDEYDHKPNEKTQIKDEYAGSFTSLSNGGGARNGGKPKESALKLSIGRLLDDIGASDDDAIDVTIVPQSGTQGIFITNVKIDFVS